MLRMIPFSSHKSQRFLGFQEIRAHFFISAGAPRRPHVHRANPLPIQPFDQRHDLRVTQTNLVASRRRPAEMRAFETLREKTKTRTVPPNNLYSIGSFRPENIQRAVKRIGPGVSNQRNESFWAFAKINRGRSQQHPCALRDHVSRTARSRRRRSPSEMSALTRTNAPPISISTRRVFAARGSTGAWRSIFSACGAAARRHAKSCDGAISSERASAEIFVPGSRDAAIARSLKSSDQRRRSPTGAPSRRSAMTSMNWFVLVLRIGLDIDVAIHVQPLPNARPAPPEWRPVDAYV